jgi:ElaB/YqjD/DUF883 family membrane-anchored ribosome-binding protein
MLTRIFVVVAAVVMAGSILPGCTSAGIAMREKVFGQAKRDQLVERVKDARDEQKDAKVQFASALDEFIAITGTKGSNLETQYRKMQKEFDRCEEAAQDVRDDINSVEVVADKLFKEWDAELNLYTDAGLRSQSERLKRDTERQYEQLVTAMKSASDKMEPVLKKFNDQTMFLKHNLNAQAISGLQNNVNQIQGDVTRLIAEMEASIKEADDFISQMGK